MEVNRMGKKQMLIAGTIMVLAAAAMTSIYIGQRAKAQDEQKAKVEETKKEQVAEAEEDTQEPAESVTNIIVPKAKTIEEIKEEAEENTEKAVIADETKQEDINEDVVDTEVVEDSSDATPTAATAETLHFSADSDLNWPLQGDVILNYSMDKTVYFATLDQYKYNPAVIIAGAVNDRVNNVADGIITDISTNETTGCTVTVDLGDGYTAIYGQLKEVPNAVGDMVTNGSAIGYVSEPTKYYSVEGSNLYFALQKDGTPVDPVGYFQ